MSVTSAGQIPAPDLSDSAVLRAVAGVRPCREGGLRIETETLTAGGRTMTVVHNYGHGGCGYTIGPGCAIEAADLVESAAGQPPSHADPLDFGVLGSGIIGLLTALELGSRGHRVTLYTRGEGYETTASGIAGGLWLPTGVEFGEGEDKSRFIRLLRASRDWYLRGDREALGIEELPVYEPEGTPHEARFFDNGTLNEPRPIESMPFAPDGPSPAPCTRPGRVFHTDFIHTPVFVASIRRRLDDLTVAQINTEFRSTDELTKLPHAALINCTALGSASLFGDRAMYPARGVLVHVKPQSLGAIVHDGYKYLFPRRDALVLGGTFQPGRTDTAVDPAEASEIVSHHRRFFGLESG